MFTISAELYSASLIAVRECMGVRGGERVLVVTDEPLRTIGYALRQAAADLHTEVLLVESCLGRPTAKSPRRRWPS